MEMLPNYIRLIINLNISAGPSSIFLMIFGLRGKSSSFYIKLNAEKQ